MMAFVQQNNARDLTIARGTFSAYTRFDRKWPGKARSLSHVECNVSQADVHFFAANVIYVQIDVYMISNVHNELHREL